MRSSRRPLLATLLLLLAAACAHAPAPESRTGSNILLQAEIDSVGATDAYDAVRKLRPSFLSDRGRTSASGNSPTKPSVFVDGQHYGEISILRTIPASQVATIRLYRAWEAQQKFGARMVAGVIEVTTRQ